MRTPQDQTGDGNGSGSGEETAPATPTATADPCGGTSQATNYTPTDQGLSVSLGENEFGNTSKLAAQFTYGACRVGSNWRFHLETLTVRIGSAVQPDAFRTNVNAATDAAVTATSYPQIMADLAPNRRVRIRVSCAGNRFTDTVPDYSRRDTYWKRQLVVDHEAFHRQDWDARYRPQLVQAEQEVWGHTLPTTSARSAADAIRQARSTLDGFVSSAYQRTCRDYAPQQESRAYADGAPAYQQLVDDIRARARSEGW
jgi:hypothetical protein